MKRGVYFEVYLDSLFILQLIMNLLLLSLVNCMMKQRVSKRRLFYGALGAASLSVILLLLPVTVFLSMSIGMFLNAVLMGVITFRINQWTIFLKFLEKLSVGTLLLGGLSLLILKVLPKGTDTLMGLTIVLTVMGLSFLLVKRLFRRKENHCCRVTLYGTEELELEALIDTGNALREPISGKPVAVLDKKIFDRLFPNYREGFRVVPYQSIGKAHGIMPAYLLNCIKVETEDGCWECREIYVGISEEVLSNSYKMILNPKIFQ